MPCVVATAVGGLGKNWFEVADEENLSGLAMDCHQVSLEVLGLAWHLDLLGITGVAGEIDSIPYHDWAGGSRSWQLCPPLDVVLLTPASGNPGFLARSKATWPTKLEPVRSI